MRRAWTVLIAVALVSGCQNVAAVQSQHPGISPAPSASTPAPPAPAQTGPPGGDKLGPRGELYSQHAAQRYVDADLAALQLPTGAVRQRGPIPAAVNKMREYLGAKTVAVDTWWTVPGTEAAVQAYLLAHLPAHFGGSISTPLHGETVLSLSYLPGVTAPETLFNEGLAQDGGHVDVRVQLQVAYLPTRTAIETIPASVTSGTAAYQPLRADGTPAPRRTITLTAAEVRAIAKALNPLDAEYEIAHSCPLADGDHARLTFRYGGHTVVFDAELQGCDGIGVTSDAVPQPDLAASEALNAVIRKAFAPHKHAPWTSTVHTAAAATAQAEAALSLVHLVGAERETAAPTPALSLVPLISDVKSQVVRTAFWSSSASAATVVASLTAHPPGGFTTAFSEGGSDTPASYGFSPAGGGRLSLLVTPVANGNHSFVRVDAVVQWTPPKPAYDNLTATSATVGYEPAPLRTVTGAPLAALAKAIDALDTAPVGFIRNCPNDDGRIAEIKADNAGHQVLYQIEMSGCRDVEVHVDGELSLSLLGTPALSAAITHLLGKAT